MNNKVTCLFIDLWRSYFLTILKMADCELQVIIHFQDNLLKKLKRSSPKDI